MTSMISGMGSSSAMNAMSTKRLTGLASGLDTDALIEGMTAGTRGKIAKAKQNKQTVMWKMDAYRSLTSKLIAFQNKFTSITSSSTLRGQSAFGNNIITALGSNSKYVSVSGMGKNAGNVAIKAVTQLAKQATASVSNVSAKVMESGAVNPDATVDVSALAGASMSIKFGEKTHTITLDSNKTYESMDAVVSEINAQLGKIDSVDGKKLSEWVKVSAEADSAGTGATLKFTVEGGNNMEIISADNSIETNLGIAAGTKGSAITGTKLVTNDDLKAAIKKESLADYLQGKEFSFKYNGKTATIKMPTDKAAFTEGGKINTEKLAASFQTALEKEFGVGRIKVDGSQGKLQFSTVNPSGGADESSVLTLHSGDGKVMEALGLTSGMSNRLSLHTGIKNSGLKGADQIQDYSVRIEVNGKEHIIDKKADGASFDENTTVQEVIDAINKADIGVKVDYMETTDTFNIVATQDGASGNFKVLGGTGNNLGEALFGNGTEAKGQDAVVEVEFGNGQTQTITRGTNSFDLEGMQVTVKDTFDSKVSGDKVTFNAKADTEKITKNVKEMIEAYNEIIELSNKMMSTRPDREFKPLTDEQKKEMSESEIKDWEEKAKEGLLFNDPDLRSFTSDIRHLFSSDPQTIAALEKMGIKTSTNYGEHGKLSFDEEAFKAAVESDPNEVQKIFAGEDGKTGIMDNVKTVFDKYAGVDKATKGIFVQKAGVKDSPLSMVQNTLQKEVNSIEDLIKELNRKLEVESERYYGRFSKLEVYINNMNSQSAWLSQQLGGMQ